MRRAQPGYAARLDRYVRLSLYANFAAVPAITGLTLAPERQHTAGVAAALAGLHALGCALLLRAGLNYYLQRGPRPTALIGVMSVATAVGVLIAHLSYPDIEPGRPTDAATALPLVLMCAFMAALSTVTAARVLVTAAAAIGAAAFALSAMQEGPVVASVVTAILVVAVATSTVTYRVTAWMLDLVWQLDRSRQVQLNLAVAEERLRFARDLHDVLGRSLSAIALKAELAARLSARGRSEAAEEMLEVRWIAQDSVTELRAVVGGYRRADLGEELDGSRSLLAAAGIDCRVIGDSSRLPASVQGPLGWVVREGVTNLLRHSEARTCTITLSTQSPGMVTLTIDNDGVAGATDVRRDAPVGSGLIGLRERLAGCGGTVAASQPSRGQFRLSAQVPLSSPAEASPVSAAQTSPTAADAGSTTT
jgi:two-component system sensor histidine kinase DesK